MFAQAGFHHGEKNAPHRALQGRVALKEVAPPLGRRQHPLPHRQARDDVVGEMGGGFDHAPGIRFENGKKAMVELNCYEAHSTCLREEKIKSIIRMLP